MMHQDINSLKTEPNYADFGNKQILIVDSPTAHQLLDSLILQGFKNIAVIHFSEIEQLTLGRSIVILPEDAVHNAVYPIIAYCDQYRYPGHGRLPFIIVGENDSLHQGTLNALLEEPYKTLFEQTFAKAFKMIKQEEVAATLHSILEQSKFSQPNSVINTHDHVIDDHHLKEKKLIARYPDIKIISSADDFRKSVAKLGKSALIIGGANGKAWDDYQRDEHYREIGYALVKSGYSIISGGPDAGGHTNGPMYHSAIGVAQAKGQVFLCYTSILFEKHCHLEDLINIGLNIQGISFVPNEAIRKSYLIDSADVIIALPGGLGTFSELLSAMTLGKPIILCNLWMQERNCNYYDKLFKLLNDYGLAKNIHLLTVSPTAQQNDIIKRLQSIIKKINTSNFPFEEDNDENYSKGNQYIIHDSEKSQHVFDETKQPLIHSMPEKIEHNEQLGFSNKGWQLFSRSAIAASSGFIAAQQSSDNLESSADRHFSSNDINPWLLLSLIVSSGLIALTLLYFICDNCAAKSNDAEKKPYHKKM